MNPKDAIGRLKQNILSVIPPASIIHEARAMTFGAFHAGSAGTGYGPFNWREQPIEATIYLDAIMRHLLAFIDGEDVADDSKVHHLAHVKAGCGIILDALENGTLIDDRPKVKGRAVEMLKVVKAETSTERPPRGLMCIEDGCYRPRASGSVRCPVHNEGSAS